MSEPLSQDAAIVADYLAGASYGDLGRKYGRSWRGIRLVLRRNAVPVGFVIHAERERPPAGRRLAPAWTLLGMEH